MRARIRRLFKRLYKSKGTIILMGIAGFIGIMIGAEEGGSRETYVVRTEHFDEEIGQRIEERIERRIEEQVIVIPEIPDFPDMPDVIYVDHHSSSFGETVNNIGTIVVSLGLIWVGVKMMVQRRVPKEKSPKSVGN